MIIRFGNAGIKPIIKNNSLKFHCLLGMNNNVVLTTPFIKEALKFLTANH